MQIEQNVFQLGGANPASSKVAKCNARKAKMRLKADTHASRFRGINASRREAINNEDPGVFASLLPLMQTLSATLADIDFAYERELELLEERGGDPALKERRRKALEQAHRERRAPYVQHLAELESRVRAGMPDFECGGVTDFQPAFIDCRLSSSDALLPSGPVHEEPTGGRAVPLVCGWVENSKDAP